MEQNKTAPWVATRGAADCKVNTEQSNSPAKRRKQPFSVFCGADIVPRAYPDSWDMRNVELNADARQLDAPPKYITDKTVYGVKRKSEILWTGRQWAVVTGGVKTLTRPPYFIGNERLESIDWIRRLAGKTWVDLDDFAEALRIARRIKKYGVET